MSALVTGAGSGMGQLAARRLAGRGVAVAAVDVDDRGLADTASDAPSVTPYPCDVTDGNAVDELVRQVHADLGPVERVMNAAGICIPGRLLEQPVEELERLMAVNYLGTVWVTKATVPGMLERGRGDLVNFASLAGWLPSLRMGGYTATKFAVVAFTEVLAHENAGRGVRFACVCPPVVDTPMATAVLARDPRSFGGREGIGPDVVIDAVEHALETGELFVFPGPGTKVAWRLRRLVPGLMWRRVERAQGR